MNDTAENSILILWKSALFSSWSTAHSIVLDHFFNQNDYGFFEEMAYEKIEKSSNTFQEIRNFIVDLVLN